MPRVSQAYNGKRKRQAVNNLTAARREDALTNHTAKQSAHIRLSWKREIYQLKRKVKRKAERIEDLTNEVTELKNAVHVTSVESDIRIRSARTGPSDFHALKPRQQQRRIARLAEKFRCSLQELVIAKEKIDELCRACVDTVKGKLREDKKVESDENDKKRAMEEKRKAEEERKKKKTLKILQALNVCMHHKISQKAYRALAKLAKGNYR